MYFKAKIHHNLRQGNSDPDTKRQQKPPPKLPHTKGYMMINVNHQK